MPPVGQNMDLTRSLLEDAVKNGFEACILTTDTWQLAWRHGDIVRLFFPSLLGGARCPGRGALTSMRARPSVLPLLPASTGGSKLRLLRAPTFPATAQPALN